MDEKNNGARRRRAFADFKENQYDDSFSISSVKQKKRNTRRVIAIILMVLVTIIFIGLGFAVTDSLIDISQQPYNDKNTYTAAFVNTTTATTTTAASEESSADGANQQVSSSVSASAYQSQQAGNY